MNDDFQLFVGVDWATEEHEVCALDPGGGKVGARSFKHSGDGLGNLCAWLIENADPRSIAVAIEVPHGVVVETLLERGFAVFSINPKQLDRFRDRFTMAGAKDDRRDALVLGDSLRTDRHLFRRLAQQPARIIELREWSRIHDELQAERGGIVNRMRAQLARYFPAFLEAAPDPGEDWAIALFSVIPDPQKAAKARLARVTKLLEDHRIRRSTPEQILETLRSTPVHSAPGAATSAAAHLRLLGEQARLLNRQLKDVRKQLEASLEQLAADNDPENEHEQRDAVIIQTMPGVGVIVAAALLGEAAELLRRRDYPALRGEPGLAGLGGAHRRHLHPQIQRRRLVVRRALADLHPAAPRGGGLPHPQVRSADPPNLAPA